MKPENVILMLQYLAMMVKHEELYRNTNKLSERMHKHIEDGNDNRAEMMMMELDRRLEVLDQQEQNMYLVEERLGINESTVILN